MLTIKRCVLILQIFIFSLLILAFADSEECTLEPDSGEMRYELADGVIAIMSWNSCTSIFRSLTFEWDKKKEFTITSKHALGKAAQLVSEWEKRTDENLSPFIGDVPSALIERSKQHNEYKFGENIPVSDYGFAGIDGVSVDVVLNGHTIKLYVHYWANP